MVDIDTLSSTYEQIGRLLVESLQHGGTVTIRVDVEIETPAGHTLVDRPNLIVSQRVLASELDLVRSPMHFPYDCILPAVKSLRDAMQHHRPETPPPTSNR